MAGKSEKNEKPCMPMNHSYAEILDEPHHSRMTARTVEERVEAYRRSGVYLARNASEAFKPI